MMVRERIGDTSSGREMVRVRKGSNLYFRSMENNLIIFFANNLPKSIANHDLGNCSNLNKWSRILSVKKKKEK